MSEETEGRVTRKLSQEFSRTKSRILVALSKLDEFLLNPQVRTSSGTAPVTSRSSNSENREPTGDRSLNDPYPEVDFSVRPARNSADSDREESSHSNMVKLAVDEDCVDKQTDKRNHGDRKL